MNRVKLLILTVSALGCAAAHTQTTRETQRKLADLEHKLWTLKHTEPHRPSDDTPLRRDNITDEEVREVEKAARKIYPEAVVNISGVTEGCSCEDGPTCSAQVWTVMYKPDKMNGLMLSKISGHWDIGPVQRWWMQWNELQTRSPGYRGTVSSQQSWSVEAQRMLDTFPQCAGSN